MKLRILWVNQVPKDEFHIPLITSMEENWNFNGGILIFKLGDLISNGGFSKESLERELFEIGEGRKLLGYIIGLGKLVEVKRSRIPL